MKFLGLFQKISGGKVFFRKNLRDSQFEITLPLSSSFGPREDLFAFASVSLVLATLEIGKSKVAGCHFVHNGILVSFGFSQFVHRL